jgi:hypothetical protein
MALMKEASARMDFDILASASLPSVDTVYSTPAVSTTEEDPFFGAWASDTATEVDFDSDLMDLYGDHRWSSWEPSNFVNELELMA